MNYEELFLRIDRHKRVAEGQVRVMEYERQGEKRWVCEEKDHVQVFLYKEAMLAYLDLYFGQEQGQWDDRMLVQDCIVLMYSDRDELDKEDYALIKSLERGYRGKKKWPQLRRARPYRVPWGLSVEDVQELGAALDVLRGDAEGTEIAADSFEPAPLHMPAAELNNELLVARFKRLEPSDTVWDVTVQAFPFPSRKDGDEFSAPYCPLMLMAVDEKTDQVLCLAVETTDKPDCTRILAQELIAEGMKTGVRPRLVRCANAQAKNVLDGVFAALGVKTELQPDVPQLAEAFESLLNFAGN